MFFFLFCFWFVVVGEVVFCRSSSNQCFYSFNIIFFSFCFFFLVILFCFFFFFFVELIEVDVLGEDGSFEFLGDAVGGFESSRCCFCWVFEAKPSSSSWKSKNFSEGGVGEVANAFGDEGIVDDVFEGGEEVGGVF